MSRTGYLTGFVHSSVGLSHVNYVEYLSAVKFNYTIKKYQFSSNSDQAMLYVKCVCVCKKSISTYRKHTEEKISRNNI